MIFNDFSILTRELSEDEIAELDELADLNAKGEADCCFDTILDKYT